MAHTLWITALPRLMAASYLAGLVMALLIRVSFRPRQSLLSWQQPELRGNRPRLK